MAENAFNCFLKARNIIFLLTVVIVFFARDRDFIYFLSCLFLVLTHFALAVDQFY